MSDLQNELGAMVQEMQNLDKAMEQLETYLASTTPKFHQMEAQTAALVTAATSAIEHHEDDLHALAQTVQTTSDQLKHDIETAETQLQSETSELNGVAEKAFTAIDAVKTDAGHLHDAVAQHNTDLQNEMHKFDDLIKGLETSLAGRISAAQNAGKEGTHELEELGSKWVTMSHTLAESIGTSLQHTVDEVDNKFVQPLSEAVKHFADLTKQIEDSVLSQPITALAQQLSQTILTEATHVIDTIVQDVEKALDDAIHRLQEAGGSNDVVNKAMQAVFHELEPVWNALQDALRSVQSIWDTVKGAVSAL